MGTKGALSETYPLCVDKVFPKPGTMPQAAMVIEGDFVVSEIMGNSTNYVAGNKCQRQGLHGRPEQDPLLQLLPLPGPGR